MQTARVVSVLAVLAALGGAFWFMARPDEHAEKPDAPAKAPAAEKRAKHGLVSFCVAPAIGDHFTQEPCSVVPGGGLYSLYSVIKPMRDREAGLITLSMGDLTLAPGGLGRRTALHHYTDVMPRCGEWLVCAGEGELGTGVAFLKEALTRVQGVTLVCANAADADGQTFLRGWVLAKAGERMVLVIGVAAESIEDDLRRRGSDVRILPAAAGIAAARTDGEAMAALQGEQPDVLVLLVHGTVDETAALLEGSPGFTFAVAAHGAAMPDLEPRKVAGVPIVYGGQNLNFVWNVLVPDDGAGPVPELTRLGQQALAPGCPYTSDLIFFRDMASKQWMNEVVTTPGDRPPDPRGGYVGAKKCAACHAAQAADHAESAHGKPSAAVFGTNFVGSTGCVGCHTTAPYWDGGWGGPTDKSDMGGVSCEACHGPGEAHAASKSRDYGHVEFGDCARCHTPDRPRDEPAEARWKRLGHRLK